MAVDPRQRSRQLLAGPDRVVARAMMKAVGFTDESLSRPQIGIGDAAFVIGADISLRHLIETAGFAVLSIVIADIWSVQP